MSKPPRGAYAGGLRGADVTGNAQWHARVNAIVCILYIYTYIVYNIRNVRKNKKYTFSQTLLGSLNSDIIITIIVVAATWYAAAAYNVREFRKRVWITHEFFYSSLDEYVKYDITYDNPFFFFFF